MLPVGINTLLKFDLLKLEENIIELRQLGIKDCTIPLRLTMLEKAPLNYLLKLKVEQDYIKRTELGLGNIHKNRDRSPYCYFLLRGITTLGNQAFAAKANFRRLHLRFLLLRPGYPNPNGFYIAGLSMLLLLTQSILCQAHQKHTKRGSSLKTY